MVKESLIKPSPAVPYPLPGVTTTFTSSSNFSVNDAEVYPSGTLVQIYNVAFGAFASNPISCKVATTLSLLFL